MSPTSRRHLALRLLVAVLLAFALGGLVALGVRWGREAWLRAQILDSGGELDPLQAAYDVRRYELELALDPERRSISGSSLAVVVATAPLDTLLLDLDHRLAVSAVEVDGVPAAFERPRDRIAVALDPNWSEGGRHEVRVVYAGRPKIAALPPWIDGFVWDRTRSGAPWVGVTLESDGADDFRPVKDHPSDEPEEGAAIELTVPRGLVGLANGRRVDERTNPDGSTTSRWEVSYPINNYLLTVAAGPYVPVVERYRGADGALDVPMTYWALPEHLGAARRLWREAPGALAIFAGAFGEFPFLADKVGAVEAPFDGMENQTLVAVAAVDGPDESGIYETLVHELAHEWWGNKVTARDWDDFWIHEGFSTFAEALYVERRFGAKRARRYLEAQRAEIENAEPLVAGRPRTAAEAYSNDLYFKGAWVLVSLRWRIGDDAFFRLLRRFAGEPGVCRLVDSAELAALAGEECGCDLAAFWERYLRRAEPPRYTFERRPAAGDPERDEVRLAWDDPALDLPFPLRVDGKLERLEPERGEATRTVSRGARVGVDTAGRLLAEPAGAEGEPQS